MDWQTAAANYFKETGTVVSERWVNIIEQWKQDLDKKGQVVINNTVVSDKSIITIWDETLAIIQRVKSYKLANADF